MRHCVTDNPNCDTEISAASGGLCYWLSDAYVPYADGLAYCQDLDGTAAIISTPQQEAVVAEYM